MPETRHQIALVVIVDVGGRKDISEAAEAAVERLKPHISYAEVIEGLSVDYEKEDGEDNGKVG